MRGTQPSDSLLYPNTQKPTSTHNLFHRLPLFMAISETGLCFSQQDCSHGLWVREGCEILQSVQPSFVSSKLQPQYLHCWENLKVEKLTVVDVVEGHHRTRTIASHSLWKKTFVFQEENHLYLSCFCRNSYGCSPPSSFLPHLFLLKLSTFQRDLEPLLFSAMASLPLCLPLRLIGRPNLQCQSRKLLQFQSQRIGQFQLPTVRTCPLHL